MGPSTGPLPASSTPNAHAGPGIAISGDSRDSGLGVGRSVGGTAEKCVYEAPAKRCCWFIEGAMKTSEAETSRAISSSICESVMIKLGWSLWKEYLALVLLEAELTLELPN